MAIDDSFRKPGAVPFKWEIRPGVPKVQQQPSSSLPLSSEERRKLTNNHRRSDQSDHQKLKPPPSGLRSFPSSPDLRARSLDSSPRHRADRYRCGQSTLFQPEVVVTSGCFPSPLLKRVHSNHRAKGKTEPGQTDLIGELETLSRSSWSTRKSLSLFRGSPSSSSVSSNRSSPRPVDDPEWAGFGLF